MGRIQRRRQLGFYLPLSISDFVVVAPSETDTKLYYHQLAGPAAGTKDAPAVS
jgi:hypothetical protein